MSPWSVIFIYVKQPFFTSCQPFPVTCCCGRCKEFIQFLCNVFYILSEKRASKQEHSQLLHTQPEAYLVSLQSQDIVFFRNALYIFLQLLHFMLIIMQYWFLHSQCSMCCFPFLTLKFGLITLYINQVLTENKNLHQKQEPSLLN